MFSKFGLFCKKNFLEVFIILYQKIECEKTNKMTYLQAGFQWTIVVLLNKH